MRLPSISKSKQEDLEERKMSSDSMRIEVIRGITGPGKEDQSMKRIPDDEYKSKDDGSMNEQGGLDEERLEGSGYQGEFESRDAEKSADEMI